MSRPTLDPSRPRLVWLVAQCESRQLASLRPVTKVGGMGHKETTLFGLQQVLVDKEKKERLLGAAMATRRCD